MVWQLTNFAPLALWHICCFLYNVLTSFAAFKHAQALYCGGGGLRVSAMCAGG